MREYLKDGECLISEDHCVEPTAEIIPDCTFCVIYQHHLHTSP